MSSFGSPRVVDLHSWNYRKTVQEQFTTLDCSPRKEQQPNDNCCSNSPSTSHSSLIESDKGGVKEEKPPFSYVALITMAIKSSATGKVTLAEIYDYLTHNFEYFRTRKNRGWMNAVRHNLTLNDCFVKLPRDPLMRGKGSFWCIDPQSNGMFNHGSLKRRRSRYTRNRCEVEVVNDIMLQDFARNTVVVPYPACYVEHGIPWVVSPYMNKTIEPPRKKQFSNFSIDAILAKDPPKKSKHVLEWLGTEVWQC